MKKKMLCWTAALTDEDEWVPLYDGYQFTPSQAAAYCASQLAKRTAKWPDGSFVVTAIKVVSQDGRFTLVVKR